MTTIPGVVTAVVTKVNEKGLAEVRVRFPWLGADAESDWIRVAAPMAGAKRGFQLMPEEKDEVLVAFEQGVMKAPYVIGCLWNGKDEPPAGKPALRTLATKSGHRIEFDDTDGSEAISLLFKGKLPSIVIKEKSIVIKVSDSNYIELGDAGMKIVHTTKVEINP